jgi:hypothetical protein
MLFTYLLIVRGIVGRREKEGLNWSRKSHWTSRLKVHFKLTRINVVQTVGLEVYEQTLYLLWYHTGELTIEQLVVTWQAMRRIRRAKQYPDLQRQFVRALGIDHGRMELWVLLRYLCDVRG